MDQHWELAPHSRTQATAALTTARAKAYISLVHECASVHKCPHNLHVAFQTGSDQRGGTIGLLAITRTAHMHTSQNTHSSRPTCPQQPNRADAIQLAAGSSSSLSSSSSSSSNSSSKLPPLKKSHVIYAWPSQETPHASHTLAWFTSAPAYTSALTTSTWPPQLAAISGVASSVCS
jgi:hypothetical protein